MNPKAKGERTEGAILGALAKRGRVVLLPFGNNQRYDLVVENEDGSFTRGQCKTGRLLNGCVVFKTCSTNGFTGAQRNYRGQVEVFWVYCPELDKIYEVPVDAVGVETGILRVKPIRGGPKTTIRWAVDYEF